MQYRASISIDGDTMSRAFPSIPAALVWVSDVLPGRVNLCEAHWSVASTGGYVVADCGAIITLTKYLH